MGLSPENFTGLSCGEHCSKPEPGSDEARDPFFHHVDLLDMNGKVLRPMKYGDMLGLSVEVSEVEQGKIIEIVSDLKKILKNNAVHFQYKGYKQIGSFEEDGKNIIMITFKDIPKNELAKLGDAIGEISFNQYRQQGRA